jgi:AcrR family transcriptional regulator
MLDPYENCGIMVVFDAPCKSVPRKEPRNGTAKFRLRQKNRTLTLTPGQLCVNERSFLYSFMVIPMNIQPAAQDARTAEILGRARMSFAEKGFDGASMQDLARSAGMSVGNFYRYFPSKAAMVEALITADMAEIERDFAQILNSPDPMQSLRYMIHLRITGEENCADDGRMWAEITAAALRKPEIAAITAKMEAGITGYLCTVFSRVTGLPEDVVHAKFGAHALFLMVLVKAAAMEAPCPGARHTELMTLVQRTIDQTLDDVIAQTKGHKDAR